MSGSLGQRIAVMVPLFPPAVRGGGPIRTIAAMVASAPDGIDAYVFTSNRDLGCREDLVADPDQWTRRGELDVYFCSAHRIRNIIRMYARVRALRPAVVYINSYWHLVFAQPALYLHRIGFFVGTEFVLAPRGEFAPGALYRHALRKRVMFRVNKLLGLHKEVTWHASTSLERTDILRMVGPQARVIVREDDTDLPVASISRQGTVSDEEAERVLCFLGRITEHKGLHIALQGLGQVSSKARLDVFGPVEDSDYFEFCKSIISRHNLNVRFRGVLEPDAVVETLARYDAMLLPTRSENFGHVVAEALAASCPVLVSPFTPWSDLLATHNAGLILERSVEAWADGLSFFLTKSVGERAAMKEGSSDAFGDWRSTSRQQKHLFDTLLGD